MYETNNAEPTIARSVQTAVAMNAVFSDMARHLILFSIPEYSLPLCGRTISPADGDSSDERVRAAPKDPSSVQALPFAALVLALGPAPHWRDPDFFRSPGERF